MELCRGVTCVVESFVWICVVESCPGLCVVDFVSWTSVMDMCCGPVGMYVLDVYLSALILFDNGLVSICYL